MIKKITVQSFLIIFIFIQSLYAQYSAWKIGFQAQYGFTNFKFGDLNKYIDSINEDLEERGITERLEHFSSGSILCGEFILRPHRLVALSIFSFFNKFN